MTTRLAINGFGRIGRMVLRALLEHPRAEMEIVAVNDLADSSTNAHLLRYDSVHGRAPFRVESTADGLLADGKLIQTGRHGKPSDLPWKEHQIDIVLECSGCFTRRAQATEHLTAGAGKVLISAPGDGEDLTVVYGVNHRLLCTEHKVVSNASCTTNCLAPIAFLLHQAVGIEHGFMTTIHSYTADQRLLDTAHADLYRARAAGLNMIPTTTGAASAVSKVLPELEGRLAGVAVRVPTPNVSLVDFHFVSQSQTNEDAINRIFLEASTSERFRGIVGYSQEPLVSCDINHDAHSAVFAAPQTKVMGGRQVRIMAWYDNEWAFANRMLDTAAVMGQLGD